MEETPRPTFTRGQKKKGATEFFYGNEAASKAAVERRRSKRTASPEKNLPKSTPAPGSRRKVGLFDKAPNLLASNRLASQQLQQEEEDAQAEEAVTQPQDEDQPDNGQQQENEQQDNQQDDDVDEEEEEERLLRSIRRRNQIRQMNQLNLDVYRQQQQQAQADRRQQRAQSSPRRQPIAAQTPLQPPRQHTPRRTKWYKSWHLWLTLPVWTLILYVLLLLNETTALRVLCLTDSFRNTSTILGPSYIGGDLCHDIYPPSSRDKKIDNVITAISALRDLQSLLPRSHRQLQPLYYATKGIQDDAARVAEQVRWNGLEEFDRHTPYDYMWGASTELYRAGQGTEGAAWNYVKEVDAATGRLLRDAHLIVAQWEAAMEGGWSYGSAFLDMLVDGRRAPSVRLRRAMQTFAVETAVDAGNHHQKARHFLVSLREFVFQNGKAVGFFHNHVRREKERCLAVMEKEKGRLQTVLEAVGWRAVKGLDERCREESIDPKCCVHVLEKLKKHLLEAGEKAEGLLEWAVNYEAAWQKYVLSIEPVSLPVDHEKRPFAEVVEDVDRLHEAGGFYGE